MKKNTTIVFLPPKNKDKNGIFNADENIRIILAKNAHKEKRHSWRKFVISKFISPIFSA